MQLFDDRDARNPLLVAVKVVKNKLAPPFREAEFEILYGIGVNKMGELVDTAEKYGVRGRRDSA